MFPLSSRKVIADSSTTSYSLSDHLRSSFFMLSDRRQANSSLSTKVYQIPSSTPLKVGLYSIEASHSFTRPANQLTRLWSIPVF